MFKLFFSFFGPLVLSLTFMACQSKQVQPPSKDQPPIEQASNVLPIAISNYSVHKVQTGKMYKIREAGTVKTFKTAWLVKLAMDNMPESTSTIANFHIGDYKIPEYGGWKDGIYFRIFDAQLLQQLVGKGFRCTYLNEATNLGKVFQLPNGIDLPLENEAVVLGRQRR